VLLVDDHVVRPRLRRDLGLGLDEGSTVLVIGSEGATDPETYERVVGSPVAAIEAAQRRRRDARTGPG
jgi:hypothetical protein